MDKTEPVVIADAGPVINLDELGCLYLLADFGRVIIPETLSLMKFLTTIQLSQLDKMLTH
jgi:hypothetical protein